MTVFNWLTILIVLLSIVMHGERRQNWKFILIACVMMYCVLGLRDVYSVGVDTTGPYVMRYDWVCAREWKNMPDLLDWLGLTGGGVDRTGHERNIALDWVMKLFREATGGTYEGFIQFSSVFTMVAFGVFIYRFSPSPIQSILMHFGLLFYNFHFSGLKQSLAMSVLLFSLAAIRDKRPVRFVMLVLLASMFHFPAIVFLPAYWIANMRVGRRYLIVLALAFLVTYLLRNQLVDWMTDAYSTTINSGTARFIGNKVVVMIGILVMAVVIRPPDPDDRIYSGFLMLLGVASVIQTFAGYNNTFERLADYYFQTAVILIPMIFEPVKLKRQYLTSDSLALARQVMPYLVCAFAIWRFWNVANSTSSHLSPYQFYFERKQSGWLWELFH